MVCMGVCVLWICVRYDRCLTRQSKRERKKKRIVKKNQIRSTTVTAMNKRHTKPKQSTILLFFLSFCCFCFLLWFFFIESELLWAHDWHAPWTDKKKNITKWSLVAHLCHCHNALHSINSLKPFLLFDSFHFYSSLRWVITVECMVIN